jgi:ABC-type multidrug transport system ATPase subunit
MSGNDNREKAAASLLPQPAENGASIEICDLTVKAGERTLLESASCMFPAGEVILLLGCSGVGKSVLLRILAGLIDETHEGIQYNGRMTFISSDGNRRRVADGSNAVSVVFQNFALLDELSPIQNVQIALDHAQKKNTSDASRAASLLADLRVPTDRPTAVLSGGQQQRLAIARAIAPRSDIVLYDEPTSGLDARTAQQVADLIRETQQRYQRTSILVTHDYETLSRIADRIILLDHTKLQLIELPKSEWSDLPEALGTPPPRSDGCHQTFMEGKIPKRSVEVSDSFWRACGRSSFAPVFAAAALEKLALGIEIHPVLFWFGGRAFRLCLYRGRGHDFGICGAGFCFSLFAFPSIYGTVADRKLTACDGILAVPIPRSDSGDDPDRGPLWRCSISRCRKQGLWKSVGCDEDHRDESRAFVENSDSVRISYWHSVFGIVELWSRRPNGSICISVYASGSGDCILGRSFSQRTAAARVDMVSRQ